MRNIFQFLFASPSASSSCSSASVSSFYIATMHIILCSLKVANYSRKIGTITWRKAAETLIFANKNNVKWN